MWLVAVEKLGPASFCFSIKINSSFLFQCPCLAKRKGEGREGEGKGEEIEDLFFLTDFTTALKHALGIDHK